MRETAFHLKDEFFEEILNGLPDKNKKQPEKESSKTSLTSDNVTRIKYVAKEFLYDQESKDFFIKIIQNAKYRNQMMVTQKTEMLSLMGMTDYDDEDTKLLKQMGSSDNEDAPLNKIQTIKEKFNNAKNIFESLKSIKGDFIRARATIARMFGNASAFYKAEKEMYEFIEGPMSFALNSTISPLLKTYIFPSVKQSILQFKDVTRVILRRFFIAFRKEMTWQINRFMAETGIIQVLDRSQLISKGAMAAKISYYAAKFSNIYTKFKRYRTLYDIGALGLNAGAIYLFGYKVDEEEKQRIDAEIERIAQKSKDYGAKLRENSLREYTVEDYKERAVSIMDTYLQQKFGFSIDDIKNELDNFSWEDLNKHSSFNKKRIYAINLASVAFFDKLDDSPLSALTKLHIRVVNHFQYAFDLIYKRLNESNEHNSIVLSRNSVGDLVPLDYELLFSNVKKNLKDVHEIEMRSTNKTKNLTDTNSLILFPKTEVIKSFEVNSTSNTSILSKKYKHSFKLYRKEGNLLMSISEKDVNRVIISSKGKILKSKVTPDDINKKLNNIVNKSGPVKRFVDDIFNKRLRLNHKGKTFSIRYSSNIYENQKNKLNIEVLSFNVKFDIVDLLSYENNFLKETINLTNGLIEKISASSQILNKLKHEY